MNLAPSLNKLTENMRSDDEDEGGADVGELALISREGAEGLGSFNSHVKSRVCQLCWSWLPEPAIRCASYRISFD